MWLKAGARRPPRSTDSSWAPPMATPRHLQEYHERGYTIVDGLVNPDLLQRLVGAARRA